MIECCDVNRDKLACQVLYLSNPYDLSKRGSLEWRRKGGRDRSASNQRTAYGPGIDSRSLHDHLHGPRGDVGGRAFDPKGIRFFSDYNGLDYRSEEHTSELQSHVNLVCRLLL